MTKPGKTRRFHNTVSALLAAAFTLASSTASPDLGRRLGTIVVSHGVVCLRIANPALAPKTQLIVVRPNKHEQPAKATIAGRSTACTGDQTETGYQLAGLKAPNGLVMIGVLAAPSDVQRRNGILTVQVDNTPLAFHVCSSTDGVHLTAWRDRPLAGPRLWHAYVYLGQDLEEDCTEKEVS